MRDLMKTGYKYIAKDKGGNLFIDDIQNIKYFKSICCRFLSGVWLTVTVCNQLDTPLCLNRRKKNGVCWFLALYRG